MDAEEEEEDEEGEEGGEEEEERGDLSSLGRSMLHLPGSSDRLLRPDASERSVEQSNRHGPQAHTDTCTAPPTLHILNDAGSRHGGHDDTCLARSTANLHTPAIYCIASVPLLPCSAASFPSPPSPLPLSSLPSPLLPPVLPPVLSPSLCLLRWRRRCRRPRTCLGTSRSAPPKSSSAAAAPSRTHAATEDPALATERRSYGTGVG